ncbi:hypothetical protein LTR85_008035 [Meristemomyces frigidus]|nr:hypothetical protein LTR85_008035 [Meristemomyces frigidus]
MGWAHKSHKKENAKRRAKNPRSGWQRPVNSANTRTAQGGSRSGRSQGVPVHQGYAPGAYAEDDGGYAEPDGANVENNRDYDMHTLAPSAPPSAYVRGNAPPPPSFQSVRDITFPGSIRGYGGSNSENLSGLQGKALLLAVHGKRLSIAAKGP